MVETWDGLLEPRESNRQKSSIDGKGAGQQAYKTKEMASLSWGRFRHYNIERDVYDFAEVDFWRSLQHK